MNNGHWHFAPTNGGLRHGINDAMQEIFGRGDPDKFIARETIQNSIDARKDFSKPITVVFRRQKIKINEIPDINGLCHVMKKCQDYGFNRQGKGMDFFRSANHLLRQPTLSVLSIEDYNTTGIIGDDYNENDTNKWLRLIKIEGYSPPSSSARGGTFGIGKGAPFVASPLRTVLYSTMTENYQVAFQGVSRLTSYEESPGDIRQRVGFYGLSERSDIVAIRNKNNIPTQFLRTEPGSNIYVLGYDSKNEKKLKDSLLEDILKNCWAAIYFNELIVKLVEYNGEITLINKDSLEDLVNTLSIKIRSKKYDPRQYYEAVENPSVPPIIEELPGLGLCKLYISLNEDGTKCIEFMRKPKLVVKAQPFALPFKFSGVFICEDEPGNEKLSITEPVDHSDWQKTKNRKLIEIIETWIRNELEKLAPDQSNASFEIPDLGDMLPIEDDLPAVSGGVGELESGNKDTTLHGSIEKEIEQKSQKVTAIFDAAPEGDKSRIKLGFRNKRVRPGVPDVEATSDGPERTIIDIESLSFRSFMIAPGVYQVVLKAENNIAGALILKANGEEGNSSLIIKEAKNLSNGTLLKTEKATIEGIHIESGETARLEISTQYKRRYKLGI
jgi:hypothetical protein